jgi:hypothetical protein
MEVGATSFLFFRLSPSLVVSPFGLHLCIYLCTTDKYTSNTGIILIIYYSISIENTDSIVYYCIVYYSSAIVACMHDRL